GSAVRPVGLAHRADPGRAAGRPTHRRRPDAPARRPRDVPAAPVRLLRPRQPRRPGRVPRPVRAAALALVAVALAARRLGAIRGAGRLGAGGTRPHARLPPAAGGARLLGAVTVVLQLELLPAQLWRPRPP